MKTFKTAEDFEYFTSNTLNASEKQDIDYLLTLLLMVSEFITEYSERVDEFVVGEDDESEAIARSIFHDLIDETDENYKTWQDMKAGDGPMYREDYNNYCDSLDKMGEREKMNYFPAYKADVELLQELVDARDEIGELFLKTPYGMALDTWSILDPECTVIRATLRSYDLIKAFTPLLVNTVEYEQMTVNGGIVPAYAMEDEDNEFWIPGGSGDCICEELIDTLNDYAPNGFYFGAHPGDGSDFGYWKEEDNQ